MKLLIILTILLIVLCNAVCTYHGIPIAECLSCGSFTPVATGNHPPMPALPVLASVALVSAGLLMGSSVKRT
jgi:hypothetical protein